MVIDIPLEVFSTDAAFPFFIQRGNHSHDLFPHRHQNFIELVIVLKGTALHQVGSDTYPIAKGDVFVVSGDVIHAYQNTKELSICNIMFRPDVIQPHISQLKTLPGYQALFIVEPSMTRNHRFEARLHLEIGEQQSAEDMIQEIQAEFLAKESGWQAMVTGQFIALLVRLSRWYEKIPETIHSEPLQIARGLSFMETNFTQNITVEDISRQACLSSRHFSRLFADSHGMSPHQYLIKMRIHYACELLNSDRIAITDVAMRCGFSDSTHFSRIFKQLMGTSPTHFRLRT